MTMINDLDAHINNYWKANRRMYWGDNHLNQQPQALLRDVVEYKTLEGITSYHVIFNIAGYDPDTVKVESLTNEISITGGKTVLGHSSNRKDYYLTTTEPHVKMSQIPKDEINEKVIVPNGFVFDSANYSNGLLDIRFVKSSNQKGTKVKINKLA